MTDAPRRGLTLLEVLVASVIMSALAAIVFLVLQRSTDTYSNESVHLSLEEQGREVLAQIARDLRDSSAATMTTGDVPVPVTEGSKYNDLRFQVNTGYDLDLREVQYARTVRYRWRMAADEVANGLDDNGNGLADEGYIEKSDRFGKVTKICDDVKKQGLTFLIGARLVTVTLELEQRDLKGTLIHRKIVSTVELRNTP